MNYLILGANAAGLSAAVRILKYDQHAKITVLEKSDVVSFGACGIPYYIAGEFDDINKMTAREYADFIKIGIDIRLFHSATGLNVREKTVVAYDSSTHQSHHFEYDRLLIAVGASPIYPKIEGLSGHNGLADQQDLEARNIFTMHSKADAVGLLALLPNVQNVVIIGAGFIGVEAAEAFSMRGKNVTLIEYSDRVLSRTFDANISPLLERELSAHNINVVLNEQVTHILNDTECTQKVVTQHHEFSADLVILATGFKPNTAFLQDTGLVFSREGAVRIDDQCRTNLPDIYAAGDCATVPHRISGNAYIPLATSANKLGRIAGEVMAGVNSRFIGTLGSSGVRIFDLEAGRTGISEEEAIHLQLNYATVFIQDKNHTDYVEPQTDMWVKLIYDKQTRVLLGGQVCGAYLGGAVHRVDVLAVAIYSGLTVDELGFMDLVYAPPFSRTWDILNIAGNVAK